MQLPHVGDKAFVGRLQAEAAFHSAWQLLHAAATRHDGICAFVKMACR